jgi:ABC-type nitrate/sulfonate/bicarbonate transport system substrate-binding protein
LTPLSVIVFPGGFNLPTWAAERQGFFQENGVRVSLTLTPNSTFQMQGLAEGRFDIAMTGFDNVVAYQEGQGEAKIPDHPELFAFMGSDNGFLSVMGGNGIARFSDLGGKRLSVDALSTGFAFVLRELLAKNGVAESDVTFERAGGLVERFPGLLNGTHAATVVLTPFDLIAQAKGHVQLARADEQLGAYLGVVGAARRSWARQNAEALVGFIRAYRQGVDFLHENPQIAEALLVANMRAMTPALARQSLGILLGEKTGFYRDVRLDAQGAQTVLALRSKYAGRRLGEPLKYMDDSYRERALGR